MRCVRVLLTLFPYYYILKRATSHHNKLLARTLPNGMDTDMCSLGCVINYVTTVMMHVMGCYIQSAGNSTVRAESALAVTSDGCICSGSSHNACSNISDLFVGVCFQYCYWVFIPFFHKPVYGVYTLHVMCMHQCFQYSIVLKFCFQWFSKPLLRQEAKSIKPVFLV